MKNSNEIRKGFALHEAFEPSPEFEKALETDMAKDSNRLKGIEKLLYDILNGDWSVDSINLKDK